MTFLTWCSCFFNISHIFHDFLNISWAKRRLRQRINDFWKISIFWFFEEIFLKFVKIFKESSKTHQNVILTALRVLKNDSSCSFPPWGWSKIIFWRDKWCFEVKTCAKMTLKKHDFHQKYMEISNSRYLHRVCDLLHFLVRFLHFSMQCLNI